MSDHTSPCRRLVKVLVLSKRQDKELDALHTRVDEVHGELLRLNGIQEDVKKNREHADHAMSSLGGGMRSELGSVFDKLGELTERLMREASKLAVAEQKVDEQKAALDALQKSIERKEQATLLKVSIIAGLLASAISALISIL